MREGPPCRDDLGSTGPRLPARRADKNKAGQLAPRTLFVSDFWDSSVRTHLVRLPIMAKNKTVGKGSRRYTNVKPIGERDCCLPHDCYESEYYKLFISSCAFRIQV